VPNFFRLRAGGFLKTYVAGGCETIPRGHVDGQGARDQYNQNRKPNLAGAKNGLLPQVHLSLSYISDDTLTKTVSYCPAGSPRTPYRPHTRTCSCWDQEEKLGRRNPVRFGHRTGLKAIRLRQVVAERGQQHSVHGRRFAGGGRPCHPLPSVAHDIGKLWTPLDRAF
jgi:hypothetical protein